MDITTEPESCLVLSSVSTSGRSAQLPFYGGPRERFLFTSRSLDSHEERLQSNPPGVPRTRHRANSRFVQPMQLNVLYSVCVGPDSENVVCSNLAWF